MHFFRGEIFGIHFVKSPFMWGGWFKACSMLTLKWHVWKLEINSQSGCSEMVFFKN